MAADLMTKDEDEAADNPTPRTRIRPELRAMNQIAGILDELDRDAQIRAMAWLDDLYGQRIVTADDD